MRSSVILILSALLILACKGYEHSNPYDPDYSGIRTRIISIHSFSVIDDMQFSVFEDGNGDGVINRGEKIRVYVSVLNSGNSVANSVQAKVSDDSDFVTVEPDCFGALNWGNIQPGSVSEGGHYFEKKAWVAIKIDKTTPENHTFALIFSFFDELTSNWQDSINLVVQKTGANLKIESFEVSKTYSRYYFIPTIINNRTSATKQVIGKLSGNDSNIELVSDEREFGQFGSVDDVIGVNETKQVRHSFLFEILNSVTTPYSTVFILTLSDYYGNTWIDSAVVNIP